MNYFLPFPCKLRFPLTLALTVCRFFLACESNSGFTGRLRFLESPVRIEIS